MAAGVTAAVAVLALPAGEAHAVDFEVQGDTVAQAYQVTNPWGDVTLDRRRLMQTLQLGVYNLQGKYDPNRADFSVVMRVRLDVDFGMNAQLSGADRGGETSYTSDSGLGARFVPGLQQAPVDLMYGYVEGRNLANGWLSFRAGRQYVSDVLGWWSFDGALARVTTPYFVQAEFYGGFEQRGGLPLSTSRYERQGIWRGSHAGFGTAVDQPSVTDYPSYQYTQPAPAFGFAIETKGPSWIHGRFSYRRVYNQGASITQQFPDPTGGYRTIEGTRLSQERLGYALDLGKPGLGALKGGFSYDLYNQLFGSIYGGLEAYIGSRATVGADFDYYVPTFDADSIWNWFTHGPIATATARASIKATRSLDLSLYGGARLWTLEGDPDTFATGQCKALFLAPNCYGQTEFDSSTGTVKTFTQNEKNRASTRTVDALANLTARYRFGTGEIGLRGMLEAGSTGRRAGGDLNGEKRFDGGRYTVGARVSVYDWADPYRPDRDATSFTYVVGAGFQPVRQAGLRLEWEHDMNRLVGQRFRVMAALNLRFGG